MEIPIAVGPSGNLQILDHLLMNKNKSHYGSYQNLRRSKGDNFIYLVEYKKRCYEC